MISYLTSTKGAASSLVAAAVALLLAALVLLNRSAGGNTAPPTARDPVTTHGEWVKIKKGNETIRAYVAYPERKTKAPAIIVIHEIFG
ncbi:MAG TPA: hypothetical protein VIM84_04690, partial [Gemmatimonadales bacterium]